MRCNYHYISWCCLPAIMHWSDMSFDMESLEWVTFVFPASPLCVYTLNACVQAFHSHWASVPLARSEKSFLLLSIDGVCFNPALRVTWSQKVCLCCPVFHLALYSVASVFMFGVHALDPLCSYKLPCRCPGPESVLVLFSISHYALWCVRVYVWSAYTGSIV